MKQPLEFKPISLSQLEKAESIRRASGNTQYVYSFASLFSWQEDEQYEICFCDDAFLVKNGAEGKSAYLFPCGGESGKKKLIDALIQYDKPVFYCVSDEDKEFLEAQYADEFRFEQCRNEYSYIYDKNAQIELSGKEYKSLRHHINKGRAIAENWEIEELCSDNIERALKINSLWAEMHCGGSLADAKAAETALRNHSQLSMFGLIFRANGKDIAYISGSFVTPEIYDLSFCKVLDNRCNCYVKWELYRSLPEEVTTIDSEEDLGIEGLREHKLFRHPKELKRIWKGSYSL